MPSHIKPTIHQFQIIRPEFVLKQIESIDWLSKAHSLVEKDELGSPKALHLKRRYTHYGCSENKIATRGTEIEDFTHQRWNQMNLFHLDSLKKTSINERMNFYNEKVSSAFKKLFLSPLAIKLTPTNLLHVTCTGYLSPSPAQNWVQQQEWGKNCKVTHLYHMGCYASIPAIRIAKALIKDNGGNTLIKHNELCTLHFSPWNSSPEQLVIQSLFSDGHIGYFVSLPEKSIEGLQIISDREMIIPDSSKDMSWSPGANGFTMSLSPLVPKKITEHLPYFLREWLTKENYDFESISKEAFFAIHPGGPKIISDLQETLKLQQWQISHSTRVLHRYGNMSSATLPHIWEKMLHSNEVPKGSLIISLAFGPGISIHGSLFKKV
ncbi:MAG: hypothetical protein CME68_07385 [Halobacteriovoraceae bacterium]|nr:hypothetical protein [Halobacteriovoraceae bacterium]